MQSALLQVLGSQSEILIGDEQTGQLVTFNGISTNSWREVFYPQTCQSGFIWSGLIQEAVLEDYDSLIFQSCPYYFAPDNISFLAFNGRLVGTPAADVMAELQNWTGKSLWRDYDDPNPLGVPSDIDRIGYLHMVLSRNEIPGQILENDLTGIWFYASPSNPTEIYVLPFRSFTTFTDANGEHDGAHLCGDHAIPRERYDEFVSWLGGN